MANRLEKEDSLYLQQHKDDKVDWWPWCDEALRVAQEQNRAIFISIGNSSSLLCKKMQREVFNDTECANLLNANFICIKVDRYERQDVDKRYQRVYELLNNRSGGWPTSVFATPQNKPFFARTFIPKESVAGDSEGIGFVEMANIVATKIKDSDEKLYSNAQEIEEFAKKVEHPTEATVLKESFIKNFMLQIKNNYDQNNGGFLEAPKFPHTATLKALLYLEQNYKEKEAKEILIHSLNAMKQGAFYDDVNGGFYRFTQDAHWQEPHLEKTLYDNALLCELYAQSYLAFEDESYLLVAQKSADFFLEKMSKNHLFYLLNFQQESAELLQDKAHVCSYSSMMITALLRLSQIKSSYKEKALLSLDALLELMFNDSKLYHITHANKKATVEAFLEDYAFLTQALLLAFEVSKDEIYLVNAQRFTNRALEEFYEKGSWKFSNGELESRAQPKDTTYTSAISVMVENLLNIAKILEDEKYTHFAFKTLEYHSYELGRKPISMPSMLIEALRYLKSV